MSPRRFRFRIRYYDAFSRVYDRFVAAHASDPGGHLRDLLAQRAGLRPGDRVLDLCTGTGAMLPALAQRTGGKGLAVGLDFSRGMLKRARGRIRGTPGVTLVLAEAERLPLRDASLHAVTCSHAFYELQGAAVDRALAEVTRTLRPGGRFLMMEHDVPEKRLLRFLFYVRLLSMGLRKAREVIGREEGFFRRYFGAVERVATDTGQSKIIVGWKSTREGEAMTVPAPPAEPEITKLVSRMRADGVPLGPEAILEAVERPRWDATGAVRDWRNYVPRSMRGAWSGLPLVARLCAFETAELAALDEDAGTSMLTGSSTG
jgi:ubiquinone/menaquinone biosynthesis C-methylase UbiE